MLLQHQVDNFDRLIVYRSDYLNDRERNLDATHREILAVAQTILLLRSYLKGIKCTVSGNYHALMGILNYDRGHSKTRKMTSPSYEVRPLHSSLHWIQTPGRLHVIEISHKGYSLIPTSTRISQTKGCPHVCIEETNRSPGRNSRTDSNRNQRATVANST